MNKLIKLYQKYKETTESEYGNYAKGRYAWKLKVLEVLKFPVEVKGQLGIWNYNDDNLK